MRAALGLIGISCLGVAVVVACGSDGKSMFDDGSANKDGGNDGASPGEPGFGNDQIDSGTANDDGADADVEAVITADNAFSFGYGDGTTIKKFIQGEGSDSEHIFNCPVGFGPAAYTVQAADAPPSAFLYVVAWADELTTQGALAQFRRVGGAALYSGDVNWQVCAVGRPYGTYSNGPSQAEVNADIANCNAGAAADASATYSHGWVRKDDAITAGARGRLAVGEANDDAGGEFPTVCQRDDAGVEGINVAAHWMWYATLDPNDTHPSWFTDNPGHRTKDYLIFRLPAGALKGGGIK